ncbi:MAG: tRNA preQ1(34) S-adenosylmethionine ribosyltransferase-isomerase QueA [bacterium]|nr:tRNA preQ1(34) S-adenosylmethionine ribosyltransferase-isomerase QueA [bacterium]
MVVNGMVHIADYDYNLPPELLPTEPASPRDSSKLFVYDSRKDTIVFDTFRNIVKYLPSDSLMVLNNTKVIPSRITLKKDTGGKVEALFLVNEVKKEGEVTIMADREVKVGQKLSLAVKDFVSDSVKTFPPRQCSTGGEYRQISALPGSPPVLTPETFRNKFEFIVISQKEHFFDLSYSFSKDTLISLLEKYGRMPIPLYLKHTRLNEKELRDKYQTIFAQIQGSTAAPTASLHFTNDVFASLDSKKIERNYVTLHVGLGTFAPITEENFTAKKLHREWYEIPENTVESLKVSKSKGLRSSIYGQKVIAVGTTVARTLESYAKTGETKGETDLFIYPPYEFKLVDALITNFHIPKSSLMMLVDAFLSHKKAKRNIKELYAIAIEEKFRFYSFGDAMLIL